MNGIMSLTIKRAMVRSPWKVALAITLATQMFTASPAVAVITPPVLWTAGGHSAGTGALAHFIKTRTLAWNTMVAPPVRNEAAVWPTA